MTVRPPALRVGDTIGIVAPSSQTGARVPRRLARGVAELERRGFGVRLGGHVSRPAGREGKLADIHAFFADDDVRAIVCTTGGADSHQLLDGIDLDLFAEHPKIFCGYSDITALNDAFHLPADELDRILLDATRGTELPIAVDFDFGHTEPHCTLPWGVLARLDADAPSLALLESAVT